MAVDEKGGGRGTCLTQAREEGGGLGALISLSLSLLLSLSPRYPFPMGHLAAGRPSQCGICPGPARACSPRSVGSH